MRLIKKTKYLFIVMGSGEAGQGRSLAEFIIKKGGKVFVIVRQKENLTFFSGNKDLHCFLVESSAQQNSSTELKKIFKEYKPDVLVLCNSKAVRYYREFLQDRSLVGNTIAVSLDSNWLFLKGEKWYDFADWLDRYCIIFPETVFRAGLKEFGGNYYIPSAVLERMETVGFIPSYKHIQRNEKTRIRKKYKIARNEKVVFSYFSGWGAQYRSWAFDKMIRSIEKLRQKSLFIRVIYVGTAEGFEDSIIQKKWLSIIDKPLSTEVFFNTMASCDLVFQHQGIATLSQAISAQIPVIANVMDLKDEKYPRHAHAWEIRPFANLGMCSMFFRSTLVDRISQEIETLLYDETAIKKMIKAQKKYYIAGEPNVYKTIKQLLRNKKNEEIKNRSNQSA